MIVFIQKGVDVCSCVMHLSEQWRRSVRHRNRPRKRSATTIDWIPKSAGDRRRKHEDRSTQGELDPLCGDDIARP